MSIEVDNVYSGWIIDQLNARLGKMENMVTETDKVKLKCVIVSSPLFSFFFPFHIFSFIIILFFMFFYLLYNRNLLNNCVGSLYQRAGYWDLDLNSQLVSE